MRTCVCVCVCVHMCAHFCVFICEWVCVGVWQEDGGGCIHAHACACVHACLGVCMRAGMYVYVWSLTVSAGVFQRCVN